MARQIKFCWSISTSMHFLPLFLICFSFILLRSKCFISMMVGVSTAARAMVTNPVCSWPGNNGANLPWSPRSEGKLGQQDTEMPIWWSRMFSVLMMIKSFAIINSKRGRGRRILKKRRWTYFAGIWTLDFLPGTVHLRNRLTIALDSIRYKHDARWQLLSQLKDKLFKPTLIFPFFLTNQNAPD